MLVLVKLDLELLFQQLIDFFALTFNFGIKEKFFKDGFKL